MREEYAPRIEYDPRYSEHTSDQLRAALDAHGEQIERLIEVSTDLPEVIPVFEFGDPEEVPSNAHLSAPRGRVQNGLRVLRADAVRLHEAGEDVEAFRRLGAAARVTLAFARQADEFHSLMGTGSGATILRECAAIVRDGVREPPDYADVASILALASHIEEHLTVEAPTLSEAIRVVREGLASFADPG